MRLVHDSNVCVLGGGWRGSTGTSRKGWRTRRQGRMFSLVISEEAVRDF